MYQYEPGRQERKRAYHGQLWVQVGVDSIVVPSSSSTSSSRVSKVSTGILPTHDRTRTDPLTQEVRTGLDVEVVTVVRRVDGLVQSEELLLVGFWCGGSGGGGGRRGEGEDFVG
jgi:hypothetical protein